VDGPEDAIEDILEIFVHGVGKRPA
jgi:hypothetical protein